MTEMVQHQGGCHCGVVAFCVEAPANIRARACNCSICRMTGYLHLIVPVDRFKLMTDRGALREYTFNTGVARHWFCGNCGVKSFYRPRSHPDGISVNVRCLDPATIDELTIEPFDGQHWEDNVVQLAPLSGN